jgi:hypothetical protein
MSKKVAIVAGIGAMGCFGMIFVVVLLVGGVIAVASLDEQPVQEQPVQPGQPAQPAQPGNEPAQPEEQVSHTVEIQGQIVDEATGQGIPGAIFVILNPGKTYDDLAQSDDPAGDGILYMAATADQEGRFRLDDLERGYTYVGIWGADGYNDRHDQLEVNAEFPASAELTKLPLSR